MMNKRMLVYASGSKTDRAFLVFFDAVHDHADCCFMNDDDDDDDDDECGGGVGGGGGGGGVMTFVVACKQR